MATLDLADGLSSHGFSAMLRLDSGRLDLDDIGDEFARGEARPATLRRDKEIATLTGALGGKGACDRPARIFRPARRDARIRVDRAKRGALIEGLAGGGTAQFAGAALARSDPAALDRVVAKAQAPDALLDETNIAYAFGDELAKAPLPIPDGSTPVALTRGP